MNPTEQVQWRPVPGYEGLYEVSDDGQVRSLDRTDAPGRLRPGRVRRLQVRSNGYAELRLSKNGQTGTVLVHRLVLAAFVGPCPDGQEARHLDGNPANNRLENLAWGTKSENILDEVRHGTHPQASKTHCPQGHPYDEANTYAHPNGGGRECRTCRRERGQSQPRANRHGSACPDWCQTDHGHVNMHTGRVIDTHLSAAMASGDVCPRVILSQSSSEYSPDREPEVQVSAVSVPGYVFVSAVMAADLADLVESLADCPPQRLRDLADEIRVAASVLK